MLEKKQVTKILGMEETTEWIYSCYLVQLYSGTSVHAQKGQGHPSLLGQQQQHQPESRMALGCHGSSAPCMAAGTAP